MSVVFVVAPAVAAVGWPVLCAAVGSVAGIMGYKTLTQTVTDQTTDSCKVEVSLKGSDIVAESMRRESQFAITNGDVTATFKRAADGKCIVHVSGKNRAEAELRAIGEDMLGRVTQHYAYNKVVTELKRQGFTVTDEEVTNSQTVRIKVRKYV